jgi:hypothetical protein
MRCLRFRQFCFLTFGFIFWGCDQDLTSNYPDMELQDSLTVDLFSLLYYHLRSMSDNVYELTPRGEAMYNPAHLALNLFPTAQDLNARNEVFIETAYAPARFECWRYRTGFILAVADSNTPIIDTADVLFYVTSSDGKRKAYYADKDENYNAVISTHIPYYHGRGFRISEGGAMLETGVLKIYYGR